MQPTFFRQNIFLFVRISILALVSSLFISMLHPIAARAESKAPAKLTVQTQLKSNPVVDSVPVNLDVTKSSNDLGDSRNPYITAVNKPGTNWPKSAAFAILFDADSGKYLDYMPIAKNSPAMLEITKFADHGVHNYQVILAESPNYLESDLSHFVDGIVGKSEILQWERKRPVTIALKSDGALLNRWEYSLNQEINGDDYYIHLFNIDNGKNANMSVTNSKEADLGVSVSEPGKKSYQYRAVLLPEDALTWIWEDQEYLERYSDIIGKAAAVSNTVVYERHPWNVWITDYSLEGGWGFEEPAIHVNVEMGGGSYGTYVVENSTGKVIWIEHDSSVNDYGIDMKGHTDVGWVTAYVALNHLYFDLPKPETLSDLTDIIASSDGQYVDLPSGVTDEKQIAGGKNLSEQCNIHCTGDPVNNATGEFFDNKTDITTVGTGLVPSVERSFSTMNKDVVKSLGTGWRTNYEMRAFAGGDAEAEGYDPNLLTTQSISIENENGSITSFSKKADGSYQADKTNTLATLKYDAVSKNFIYDRFKTKEVFIFDSTGKLVELRNDKNQAVKLTHDDQSRVASASDLVGNVLTFSYHGSGTSSGLLASVTAHNGKKATYSYNNKKQLTSVKNDGDVSFAYTYDTLNRIKTLTNELGGAFTNTYDSEDRVIKQVDPLKRATTFTYYGDFQNGTTQIKYPNAKVIEETYRKGQIAKKVENSGKSNALTWNYSYDLTGNLVSTTTPEQTSTSANFDSRGNQIEFIDGSNNPTYFTYDENDNLLKIKDALGNETSNTYDSWNNLTSTTSPLGEKTTFIYDVSNRLVSVTDPRGNAVDANPADFTSTLSYLPNGLLETTQDAAGNTTGAKYDSFGQVISAVDAKGYESKISYNALGLPSKVVDPLQNETAISYDALGNVLKSENAAGFVTTYTYDSVGNMLTATNALNETTTYTYSNMDKPTKITFADGTTQSIKYDIFDNPIEMTDQLNRVIKQEFDRNGNLTVSIDADGGRTEYNYNRDDLLASVKDPVGSITKYSYDQAGQLVSVVDGLGRVTKTAYDANGKVIENVAADGTSKKKSYDTVGNIIRTTDQDGNSKVYTYDSLNRQTSYTNEIGQITTYSYDKNSNLISQKRPDDSLVNYEYDARDLLTRIDYPEANQDVFYTYDSIGRKTSERKGVQLPTEYSYDSLNRIKSQGQPDSLVSYNYDLAGNLTNMTYPSGRVVNYAHDAAGQVVSLNTAEAPEALLEYNKRGLETKVSLQNGITETTGYDAASRLTGSELKNVAGVSIYKRTQQYNSANEVTQKGVYADSITVSLSNFIYDPTSRLTDQKRDDDDSSIASYSYNAVGNLSSVNTVSQAHDKAGRITASGDSAISYDERNNRSGVTDPVDSKNNVEYFWTQNNQLSEVTTHENSAAITTKYEYTSDGLLSTRTQGKNSAKFVWDTNREIPVMLSDGEFEYVYKTHVDRVPFAQVAIATRVITYLHSDLTGSIVASTNMDGELSGQADYSPYGERTSGTALSNFGYAGEWTDETTSYTFLRARWMDAKTGSFLSEDPLIQMTNNAFGYTEGNPLIQIDPLGLFSLGGFGDLVYEHSGLISAGLTIAGIAVSATGIGAPIGLAITGVGMAVSGYSAYRDFKKGDTVGVITNALGVIPGAGLFSSVAKTARATKNAKSLVSIGAITTRKESRSMTLTSRRVTDSSENVGIGVSGLGLAEYILKRTFPIPANTNAKVPKGADECA